MTHFWEIYKYYQHHNYMTGLFLYEKLDTRWNSSRICMDATASYFTVPSFTPLGLYIINYILYIYRRSRIKFSISDNKIRIKQRAWSFMSSTDTHSVYGRGRYMTAITRTLPSPSCFPLLNFSREHTLTNKSTRVTVALRGPITHYTLSGAARRGQTSWMSDVNNI